MKKLVALVAVAAIAVGWWWTREAPGARTMPAAVVNVVAPRSAQLVRDLRAVGSAQARAAIDVTSRVDGRLQEIHFTEGQQVSRGDLLVSLDSRTARASLAAAEARLANATLAWERANRLQRGELLSEAEADALEAALKAARAEVDGARAHLQDHEVRAAFAGTVGLRRINAGSYVKAGEVLTTLDDLSRLEVVFSVPERYLGELAVGQTVAITSESHPDREFAARLARIDSRVDPVSRMVTAKAEMDNADRALRPGQFLAVRLRTAEYEALMIPEQAVLTEGAGSFAWVVSAAQQAERRQVVLGDRRQGWVEVKQGIQAGDAVVVNGNARLGNGAVVEVRDDPEALLPVARNAFLDEEES